MQPRFGQVPPSRSGSIIATVSPASRGATVTPIPALPPPRITTSKLRLGIAFPPRGSTGTDCLHLAPDRTFSSLTPITSFHDSTGGSAMAQSSKRIEQLAPELDRIIA